MSIQMSLWSGMVTLLSQVDNKCSTIFFSIVAVLLQFLPELIRMNWLRTSIHGFISHTREYVSMYTFVLGLVRWLWFDAVVSQLAKANAALIWQLWCHWSRDLTHRKIAIVIRVPGTLNTRWDTEINRSCSSYGTIDMFGALRLK